MKIAYITAGAAGMYCGTCIHDNTLARALQNMGHDVALIPTYTPIRTDELDVSIDHVFFGGINVYLEQKSWFFRHTPWCFDELLNSSFLLRHLSRFTGVTDSESLGALTLSMLQGENGKQKKELKKLIKWLRDSYHPDLVHLTNSMFVGFAREIKTALRTPIVCALQGEDLFLEGLVEPYKSCVRRLLRERALDVNGFIAPCRYYAEFMGNYLNVSETKIDVVPLGLNLEGHGAIERPIEPDSVFVIGYLARICPVKGLHLLVQAFYRLTQKIGTDRIRLKVAGYLGAGDKQYLDGILKQINAWGLTDVFSYQGEVNRSQKIDFLNSIHVLSVPTSYPEPKGLFVLEALANGVPVVVPRHGGFPELVGGTGGGLLVNPNQPMAIAEGILELLNNPTHRIQLGAKGKESVNERFSDDVMAKDTLAVYRQYILP